MKVQQAMTKPFKINEQGNMEEWAHDTAPLWATLVHTAPELGLAFYGAPDQGAYPENLIAELCLGAHGYEPDPDAKHIFRGPLYVVPITSEQEQSDD